MALTAAPGAQSVGAARVPAVGVGLQQPRPEGACDTGVPRGQCGGCTGAQGQAGTGAYQGGES